MNADLTDGADFHGFIFLIFMKEEELTEKIIKTFYKVYNTLGYGFWEIVYHRAILIELEKLGLSVENKKQINVYYEGSLVGDFETDLVVENKVIVELKAKETLNEAHEAQLINYLRSTEIEIGLLFNFGNKPQFKRKYFSNSNKISLKNTDKIDIIENLFKN